MFEEKFNRTREPSLCVFDTYYISYRYAGNGVIAYDYYKVTDWDTVKSYASAAGMTIFSALAFLISQGAVQLQPAW